MEDNKFSKSIFTDADGKVNETKRDELVKDIIAACVTKDKSLVVGILQDTKFKVIGYSDVKPWEFRGQNGNYVAMECEYLEGAARGETFEVSASLFFGTTGKFAHDGGVYKNTTEKGEEEDVESHEFSIDGQTVWTGLPSWTSTSKRLESIIKGAIDDRVFIYKGIGVSHGTRKADKKDENNKTVYRKGSSYAVPSKVLVIAD